MSDKSHMHDHGESDRSIVTTKSRNKGGPPPADGVEGRGRTKENTVESNPCRTQSRVSGSSRLDGVRQAAQCDKQLQFTALLHHVTGISHGNIYNGAGDSQRIKTIAAWQTWWSANKQYYQ